MSTLRRSIPALLLGMLLFLCIALSPAAWADGSTAAALQAAVERGDKSFTLTGDLTIPKGTAIMTQSTTVVVPKGKTLILDGGILDAAALRLVGGKIEVRSESIFRVNEKFDYSSGTVEVYQGFNLFPAADILPDNTGVITYPNGLGTTTLRFAPTSDSEFAAAVAAINGMADNFEANVELRSPLTLTGMHVLTHKTFLYVFDTLTLENGAQLVYDRCGGNVSVQFPKDADKGGAIINNGVLLANVNLAPGSLLRSTGFAEMDELTLGGDVEIDGHVFRVHRKLTNNGGTVKVYSGYNLFPAAAVLSDTGVITYPNGTVETNLIFYPTNASEFADAVASINGMAENFIGNINVQQNIELTGKHTLTHKTFLDVNAALTLASGAHLEYDKCGGSVSLRNPNPGGHGGAIINEGVLLVNNISLMPGCLLRSTGTTETNELRFGNEENVGGDLEIAGGFFRVNRKLICSGGSIRISRKCFNLFPAADVLALSDYTSVFQYDGDDIQTNLLLPVSNNKQALAALETANGLDDRFIADISVNFPWRITADTVLSHKTELRIHGGSSGSLTVNQGASFTKTGGGNIVLYNDGNPQCQQYIKVSGKITADNLFVDPGCALLLEDTGILTCESLQIGSAAEQDPKARFAHNGLLVLYRKPADNPEARLIMKGDYEYGDGMIYIMGTENLDSYFADFDTGSFEKTALDKGTLYAPFAVDLVLPAKLRGLEEEAFAEGGFITVYIPANVKSIDDSAFAGIDGMCVIGHSGTEAQRFAAENGFEFIALS